MTSASLNISSRPASANVPRGTIGGSAAAGAPPPSMTRSSAILPTSTLTLLLPESCVERPQLAAGPGCSRFGSPSSDESGIPELGFGYFVAICANSCTKQGLTSFMHERSYAGHASLQFDDEVPQERRLVSATRRRRWWSGPSPRPVQRPARTRSRAGRAGYDRHSTADPYRAGHPRCAGAAATRNRGAQRRSGADAL